MKITTVIKQTKIAMSIMALIFQLHQSIPLRKWQRMLCLLIGIIDGACP